MEARLVLYARRDSVFHRMDARWKLAAFIFGSIAVVTLQNTWAAGTAFLGSLVLLLASRLPWRWFLGRLSGVGLFLTFFLVLLPLTMPGPGPQIGPVTFSWHGLQVAGLICLKALTLVAIVLFLFATEPFEMTLKAAHALRAPSLFVHLLMLTYRYIFLFGDELQKLRIALRLRGYRNRASRHCYRTIGNVTGTLLVRSYERAERVGQAMRCRGFDGQFRSLHQFRTRTADVVKLVVVLFLLGGLPWMVDLIAG
jgi:cobalt/nickel transport system permease protein